MITTGYRTNRPIKYFWAGGTGLFRAFD